MTGCGCVIRHVGVVYNPIAKYISRPASLDVNSAILSESLLKVGYSHW